MLAMPRPLPSSIDALKHAVTSVATCTHVTAQELTLLLTHSGPLEKPGLISERGGAKSRPLKRTGDARARGPRAEPAIIAVQTLNPAQRIALATEVINASLRSLAQAISDRACGKSCEQSRDSQLQNAAAKSSSASPQALHNRSVNVLTPSPRKGPKPSASLYDEREGVHALAECARIAFAALRKYYNGKEPSGALPFLQIEGGMSVLVGKLIALDLQDLAIKELWILTKRLGMGQLCQVDSSGDKRQDSRVKHRQSAVTDKQSLANLLLVLESPKDHKHLSLVVATQLQILKVLGFSKSTTDLESVLRIFDERSAISPTSLIEALGCLEGTDKCSRQLANLAQYLLLLCEREGLRDAKRAKVGSSGSATNCLYLQTQALQILWKSWIVCGHNIDVTKQLVKPFRKYLDSYISIPTDEPHKKCVAAEIAITRISDLVGSHRTLTSSQVKEFEDGKLQFEQLLVDLYRASGDYPSALKCLGRSLKKISDHGASGARRSELLCQVASIELQSMESTISENCCKALEQAIISFSQPVNGNSAELDEMMISISSLRKAAVAALTRKQIDEKGSIALQCQLQTLLTQCILTSLEFLVRYLGSSDASSSKISVAARFEKRRVLAKRIARPTAEGVIYLSKIFADADASAWGKFHQGLQNSIRLVKKLDDSELEV